MIAKSIEELTIYESPDGGKTIYSRKSGSPDRTMIREDASIRDRIMEDQLWYEIRKESQTNTTLADILDKARMVYALIKKETN